MRLFLFLLLLLQISFAESPALKSLLESPMMKPASIGVCVIPLKGDEVAMEWRADKSLTPASTMKVVTTATALQLLGPEFVFETKLYLKDGNLVVKGGGDPTLGATGAAGEFASWLSAIKATGVFQLNDLWIDPSRFEEQRAPNDWPSGDVGNYYGAGPSGVNYHLNSFALTFRPGSVGAPATLSRIDPTPPGVVFLNEMKTGAANSGDRGYVYGGPGAKVMTLRGSVPAGSGYTIRGALPDPPLMCGTALKEFLITSGIRVNGQVKVGAVELANLEPILVLKSPSLLTIIKATNHRSVNLYADSIFKALTPAGTTRGAVSKVKSHWQKQGVDLTGFVMQDGSGLSPRGTMTPRQLAMILKKARAHKTGPAFYESLPMAGQSGTLSGFGNGTAIDGKLRAKSGGMTRVRSYAGYFIGKSGREYAFAVMANNATRSPTRLLASFLAGVMDEN